MTALVVSGAIVFLLLGVGHAILMLQSTPTKGAFAASEPDVQAAMQARTGLGLAPDLDTTLWRAWVGFNLSHALGVVVIAAVVLFHAGDDLGAAADRPWFLALAIGVPTIYLVLSVRYWFAAPTRGIALGWILLTIGVVGTAVA